MITIILIQPCAPPIINDGSKNAIPLINKAFQDFFNRPPINNIKDPATMDQNKRPNKKNHI